MHTNRLPISCISFLFYFIIPVGLKIRKEMSESKKNKQNKNIASKFPNKNAKSILHSTYNDGLLNNFILANFKKRKKEKSLTKVHVFTELWNMHLDTANKKL